MFVSCSLLDQLWVCSEYYSNMLSVETSVRTSVLKSSVSVALSHQGAAGISFKATDQSNYTPPPIVTIISKLSRVKITILVRICNLPIVLAK